MMEAGQDKQCGKVWSWRGVPRIDRTLSWQGTVLKQKEGIGDVLTIVLSTATPIRGEAGQSVGAYTALDFCTKTIGTWVTVGGAGVARLGYRQGHQGAIGYMCHATIRPPLSNLL